MPPGSPPLISDTQIATALVGVCAGFAAGYYVAREIESGLDAVLYYEDDGEATYSYE